jgi:hypothetical protein
VLDALMADIAELRGLEIVDRAFVGHEGLRVFRNIIRDDLVNRFGFVVRRLHQSDRSAALAHADNNVLILEFAAMAALLPADSGGPGTLHSRETTGRFEIAYRAKHYPLIPKELSCSAHF